MKELLQPVSRFLLINVRRGRRRGRKEGREEEKKIEEVGTKEKRSRGRNSERDKKTCWGEKMIIEEDIEN
jgi:hypothetical protein